MNLTVVCWAAWVGTCIANLSCDQKRIGAQPVQAKEENSRKSGTQTRGNVEPNAVNALKTLLSTEDCASMYKLPEVWKKALSDIERKSLVALLQERVDSLAQVKLTDYADLCVLSRCKSGRMQFHGHGPMLDQDVFLEGGRCAWALENLLDLTLPAIEEDLSKEELDKRAASARSLVTSAIR